MEEMVKLGNLTKNLVEKLNDSVPRCWSNEMTVAYVVAFFEHFQSIPHNDESHIQDRARQLIKEVETCQTKNH